MKRLLSAFVTLFLSFFGFVLLISENVLATYQPPAVNPNLDSVTEYICYSQASGVNAAWSIIYKKSDFNCGGIPAGINFYPDYGVKVGCTGNGSNIATGGSYDIYSYYSNSWHKDDWSGYGAVNNANSLDSQIACSVDLPASYPGFVFQGSYYSYGQTIMQANYTPPSSQQQLYITRSPELGGGVIITVPPGFPEYQCGLNSYEDCEFEDLPYNSQVTLEAQANSGYAFSHWEINDLSMADADGIIDITMSEDKEVKAVFYLKADDFVFPVLSQGITDPLLNNTLNPDGNGWHGSDVGELAKYEGHLGQDYSVNSGSSAGQPVYAVSNGTIVEVMNNQNYSYGWCDSDDHGWGPVVVIRHENRDGFNTTGSIISTSCCTETNPTVIYSLYGHLSKTSIQNLQIGQTVTKGQQLGVLGSSGTDWSSEIGMAPHLHFELKDEVGFNEKAWYYNPINWGVCPGSASQSCGAEGVGTGYSHSPGFAPHRYSPDEFIFNN